MEPKFCKACKNISFASCQQCQGNDRFELHPAAIDQAAEDYCGEGETGKQSIFKAGFNFAKQFEVK